MDPLDNNNSGLPPQDADLPPTNPPQDVPAANNPGTDVDMQVEEEQVLENVDSDEATPETMQTPQEEPNQNLDQPVDPPVASNQPTTTDDVQGQTEDLDDNNQQTQL